MGALFAGAMKSFEAKLEGLRLRSTLLGTTPAEKQQIMSIVSPDPLYGKYARPINDAVKVESMLDKKKTSKTSSKKKQNDPLRAKMLTQSERREQTLARIAAAKRGGPPPKVPPRPGVARSKQKSQRSSSPTRPEAVKSKTDSKSKTGSKSKSQRSSSARRPATRSMESMSSVGRRNSRSTYYGLRIPKTNSRR